MMESKCLGSDPYIPSLPGSVVLDMLVNLSVLQCFQQ